MDDSNLKEFLAPTPLMPSDDPELQAYAQEIIVGASDEIDKACRLYYAVRDNFRYDPYEIELTPLGLSAKTCFTSQRGFCVTKSALLVTLARASNIPARVGYADVRNHLSTGRLKELMGTDIFIYHGYAEVHLDGRWVKATPVFNLALCDKFRVLPLEFDGRADSLFHPHNADNRRHMEYVNDHGTFAEVPASEIIEAFKSTYPNMFVGDRIKTHGDFDAEAIAENS